MNNEERLRMSRVALAVASRLEPRDSGHVVLVTSARPKEGKSFVAHLLAKELSQTLYTDLVLIDTSRPKVAQLVQEEGAAGPGSGLSKLIADGLLPDIPPTPDGTPRLLYLSSGNHLRAGLFNVGGVARAFEVLRQRFKLTVVDAPVLTECGATLMHADAIVLVVDSRHTPPSKVREAMATAQIAAERITGVLLNHAPAGAGG